MQQLNLTFVDESGEPQSGLKIGFYLAGQHLPYRPCTDVDGKMLLELSRGLPLQLEVRTRSGVPLRFLIENLSSGQSVTIPSVLPRKAVSFRGESGEIILGLQVVGDGFPENLFAKHDGSVDIPLLLGRRYQAQASGYFPVIINPNVTSEVTLPRSVSRVSFRNAPQGTQYLFVQSQARLESPLPLEGWAQKGDDGSWQTKTLPAGGIIVAAYDANDSLLGEFRFILSATTNSFSLMK